MDAPLDREEFARWREEADHALAAAAREAHAENHNWACFLAEQAGQLAVKALLHGLGRAPWGHDLEELTRAVGEAGVELPQEVTAGARLLARHCIPARYPDAHPGGAPGSRYVADDSAGALEAAETLLAFVDRTWQHDRVVRAVEERYAERERLVGLAREHVRRLAKWLPVRQAAVVGSVARGDFNVWSDVDVVVVADTLPGRALDRLDLLMHGRPPRLEPTGFTPAELEEARRRRNPLVVELDSIGIPLL